MDGPDVDLATLEKLGEGYEAEIFAWEDGRALRLFREGHERNVEPERIAIPAALAGGIPAPQIGEAVTVAGREGHHHGAHRRREPARPRRAQAVPHAARGVGDRQDPRPPERAPRPRWARDRPRARARVDRERRGARSPGRHRRRGAGGLDGGDRFCHSDFHPGNILLEPNGRRVVIDWGFCAAGPVESDVARSVALLWLGEPLDPSPALRVITRFFRPIATGLYLRAYRSVARIDTALMWRWVVVRAIEHLAIVRAISPPDAGIPRSGRGSRGARRACPAAQRREALACTTIAGMRVHFPFTQPVKIPEKE